MLDEYRKQVAERAAEGLVPKPLSAEQAAALVDLIKTPQRARKASCWNCWLIAFLRVSMKPPMSRQHFSQRLQNAKQNRKFFRQRGRPNYWGLCSAVITCSH